MSGFSAFAADLATRLSVETGWAWQVDGAALVLPVRGFALDLRPLWGLAQHGSPTQHLAQGVLAALQEGSLADQPDRLRIQVVPAPVTGEVALPLHPFLWLRFVLDLPLRTQGLTWQEVSDPHALLPDALRRTMRAPDLLVPLYVGGPVAHYHGRAAPDAAVAHGLLADGALVAAFGSGEALVLQTSELATGCAPFQDLVAAMAPVRDRPPPPIWVFRHGSLAAVLG